MRYLAEMATLGDVPETEAPTADGPDATNATDGSPDTVERPWPPPRPSTVPADAVFDEESGEWLAGPTDADGKRNGETRAWRVDGTPAGACVYRAGVLEGAFRRFHPDGTVAREVAYVEGRRHGLLTAWAHEQPSPEVLQSCCVPPGAFQLQIDYDQGSALETRWYDRSGAHILPSGKPHPVRPASVPARASFEERHGEAEAGTAEEGAADRWVQSGGWTEAGPNGLWLRWSRDGVLRERDELVEGRPHGMRQRFDARGALLEEGHFVHGVAEGPYRRRVPAGLYADERVVEERGTFQRGIAFGTWSLHADAGELLRTFDLGQATGHEELIASPVFGAPRSSAAWAALADELEHEGRLSEALLAAARASAAAEDADPLRTLLACRTPLLTPEGALEVANTAVSLSDDSGPGGAEASVLGGPKPIGAPGKMAVLMNALCRGGDPARLLRAAAAVVDGAERAALDLIDAALLMNPSYVDSYITRALVNVHLGRPRAARADAAKLGDVAEGSGAFLDTYTRVIFPSFGFWPKDAEIRTSFPEVPPGPEQPLEAIRLHVQKYATRVALVRSALIARLRDAERGPNDLPEWVPPDLSALLSPVLSGDEPLLSRWTFDEVVVDETGAQGEPQTVSVDEQLAVPPDIGIPALMRQARADWNALCWLCWSAGLEEVALPSSLSPPAAFGEAAAMSVERTWRCRDKLSTAGLRAMTQGVPGFVWEGMEVDEMPGAIAEIATAEYLEMRSLFYWLCDAGVQSPWQDNLRAAH